MSKPAAIMASLVDVRNIAAHKCVRLELHVPVEQASLVMAAFGWPTVADPVPVAIARLVEPDATSEPASEGQRTARHWRQVKPPQQAGIRCDEKAFQRFLSERYDAIETTGGAAECVRDICGVSSRSDIGATDGSARAWRELDGEYQFWLRNA